MKPPVTAFSETSLPNELVDIIIDHLHDDRTALSACCTVCKAWLPSSRYHLFSDIVLTPRNSDYILSLPPPSMFATAARRLMLTDKNSLPDGIEYFSSVKSFYLRAAKPCPDMTSRIALHFPKITHLELNQVAFESFGQMIQLLCSFPNLESLTHFMCPWMDEGHQLLPLTRLRLSTRLHTLNILSIKSHTFFDWFNALEIRPKLSTLRVYELTEPHISPIATAMEGFGGSLEHLTLDLLDHNAADTLVDTIDLSHNTNLRSFTLINGWPKLLYHLLLTQRPTITATAASAFAMNAAPTSKLEHITLTIYEGKSDIPNLDLLDWDDLDHLLTSTTTDESTPTPTLTSYTPTSAAVFFQTLTTFTIRIYAHRILSLANKEVVESQYMPLCGAKGVLKYVAERERILGLRRRMKGPVEPRSWGEEISDGEEGY